jgi:membrane protein
LGLTSVWLLALNTVHAGGQEILGWLTLLPSLVIDSAVFAALYRFTPTISVRTRAALIAGPLAASAWEITKLIFGWWVIQVGTYNGVYGPLAASIIVMLWLWVSAIVFLFGAGLTATMQKRWEAADREVAV